MPDPNRNSETDKNDKRNGEMRLPPRTFMVWIAIIAIAVIVMFVRNGTEAPIEEMASFPDLLHKMTNGLIVPGSGRVIYGLQSTDIQRITGKYYSMQDNGKPALDPGLFWRFQSGQQQQPDVEPVLEHHLSLPAHSRRALLLHLPPDQDGGQRGDEFRQEPCSHVEQGKEQDHVQGRRRR
jgi:hypothetical protein